MGSEPVTEIAHKRAEALVPALKTMEWASQTFTAIPSIALDAKGKPVKELGAALPAVYHKAMDKEGSDKDFCDFLKVLQISSPSHRSARPVGDSTN